MKILMMTNTYLPIVGGLEKSIQTFSSEFRKMGHQVKIVAPEFEGMPKKEKDVIRIPAIRNVNGTDFSLNLPMPGLLSKFFEEYKPDICHAHHPFLIGDMALRLCGQFQVPLVFTYHTMFEWYTDYFGLDNPAIRKFVVRLAAGYANLCDQIIVPSESIERVLKKRKIKTPIAVVPTGVDVVRFLKGKRKTFRKKLGIPDNAFVLGHLGRLSKEKNLDFLTDSVISFLRKNPEAVFLVIGKGSAQDEMEKKIHRARVCSQVYFPGVLKGQALVDAYHAMDLFAFASRSETQGMVVTEAMSSGLPVVALDAPGVREVVINGKNGKLLRTNAEPAEYVRAIEYCMKLPRARFKKMQDYAIETANTFSLKNCAQKALQVYKSVKSSEDPSLVKSEGSEWEQIMGRMTTEWEMLTNLTQASGSALAKLVTI